MMTWRKAVKLGTNDLLALAQEYNVLDEVLAIREQTRYWYFKACSLVRNRFNATPAIAVEVEVLAAETVAMPVEPKVAVLSKAKRIDVDGIRYALDNSDFTQNEKKEQLWRLNLLFAAQMWENPNAVDTDDAIKLLHLYDEVKAAA